MIKLFNEDSFHGADTVVFIKDAAFTGKVDGLSPVFLRKPEDGLHFPQVPVCMFCHYPYDYLTDVFAVP